MRSSFGQFQIQTIVLNKGRRGNVKMEAETGVKDSNKTRKGTVFQ